MIGHGSKRCHITCEEGFHVSDAALQPACEAGVFSPGEVACAPDECVVERVYAPAHGYLDEDLVDCKVSAGRTPPRLQHGQNCSLRCDEGYKMVGRQPHCLAGVFQRGTIDCLPEPCAVALPDAALPAHATRNGCADGGADGGALLAGEACALDCDAGYTLFGRQPSCAAGTFDPGSIECLPNPCPVPADIALPSHGALGGACRNTSQLLPHGASCAPRCDEGYVYNGTQPSCSAGVFSPGAGQCTAREPESFLVWLDDRGRIRRAALEADLQESLGETEGTDLRWLLNTTMNMSGVAAAAARGEPVPFALDAARRTLHWVDREAGAVVAASLPADGGAIGAGDWVRAEYSFAPGGAAQVGGLAAEDGLLLWGCGNLSGTCWGGAGTARSRTRSGPPARTHRRQVIPVHERRGAACWTVTS